MDKKQALEIFAQIVAQFRATPQDHEVIKQAFAVLNSCVEPTAEAK